MVKEQVTIFSGSFLVLFIGDFMDLYSEVRILLLC